MRFLINFFVFGFLFFLIYIFFPEAFATLVSWAQSVYDFLRDMINSASNAIRTHREQQPTPPPVHETPTRETVMVFLAMLKAL